MFENEWDIDESLNNNDELDEILFGIDSEMGGGLCPPPSKLQPPFKLQPGGTCRSTSMHRNSKCNMGLWYLPERGKSLWRVARDVLRANPGSSLSVREYMELISKQSENENFRRNSDKLATRAFLPRWDASGRKKAIRGRGQRPGYGLIFLPALPINTFVGEKRGRPQYKNILTKITCPYVG